MPTLDHLIDMLDRAYQGKICSQETWDMEIISQHTAEILKRYDLRKTCDKENPINSDDSLADRFFQAGVALATVTGMYCIDTERVIVISEEEIADAIQNQPAEVRYGLGKDQVIRRRRMPEDSQKPIVTALIGTPISEDLYVDLTSAIASIPGVDCLSGCTLETARGLRVIGGAPSETIAGYYEAELKRAAIEKAGRPGMSVTSTETSPTAYGTLASFGVPGGFNPEKDMVAILGIAELKTSFELFQKAIHGVQCGGRLRGGQPGMIGGYAGGPEAAAVANLALVILQRAVFGVEYGGGNVLDVRYQGNSGRAGLWAQGIVNQAISRNSNFLADAVAFQVAGPNTEMLLWETAIGVLNCVVSGASGSFGPYTSGGIKVDYLTPLETKFWAELAVSGTKMTRSQVNELAKEIVPRYEDHLFRPPIGQPLQECYYLPEMRPKEDWRALYSSVKEELSTMGVPFEEQ
jgi:methylamine---corrinoid protein Co-methyltransferase